ncbi:MAG: hypothetical protein ACLU80_03065 [Dorea sp.]
MRRFTPRDLFNICRGTRILSIWRLLIEDELLTKEECDQADFGENRKKSIAKKIYNARFKSSVKLAPSEAKRTD